MANLKNKILQILNNRENIEDVFANLSLCQENLLKNHSNPVFNKKDKSKILKQFTNLQNIGKSLYRYNALNENNFETDEERADIENIVLKGGISYNKYVWHSENGENTCELCKSLDGKVFDFYDEVPERPHPNCKCTVEILEGDDLEVENIDDTNETPTPQPAPQPAPKLPQPAPQPSIPPKTQKWILPVSKEHKITSYYGYRMHPVYHTMKLHDGIDINALANTPVHAVADGKVSVAGWINGYGNYIQIEHSDGLSSFYAHLNKINIPKGSSVKQGQNIGLSGNTGVGTGPHLHFGAKKNGRSVDPVIYLPSF